LTASSTTSSSTTARSTTGSSTTTARSTTGSSTTAASTTGSTTSASTTSSSTTTGSTTTGGSGSLNSNQTAFLNAINAARQCLGASCNLTYNVTLENQAMQWASYQATTYPTCTNISHNTALLQSTGQGENSYSMYFNPQNAAVSITDGVNSWIAEAALYICATGNCSATYSATVPLSISTPQGTITENFGECLHYTQIMATVATQVGCALVVCSSGQSIAYCRFDHNGNIENMAATQANGGNPIINPPFPTSLCTACSNLNSGVRDNAQVAGQTNSNSNSYSFFNDTTAVAIVFTSLGVACVALIISIVIVVFQCKKNKASRRSGMTDEDAQYQTGKRMLEYN